MTTAVTTPPAAARVPSAERRLDLIERLFVVSGFVAPLSVFLVKSFTLYDVMVLVIAFLIVAGPRRLEPLPRPVAAAGLFFLLAALVSVFRASVPSEALTQTAQFAFIWFVQLPVVLTLARSRAVLRGTLLAFLAGAFGSVALAAIFQAAQGADRFLVFYSDNPNRLGYASAYLLPFVVFFVADWWRSGRRALALGVGVPLAYLMLWALAASASRGATLATVVAIAVYFVLRPQVGLGVSLARLLSAVAFTAVSVLVLTKSGLFPLTLEDRISRTFDVGERTSLINDRASLAKAGLRAFADSPLVGTGLDNFRYLAPLYADGTTLQAPHNLWIQFLAQIGLVGTAAFAYFVVRWFWTLLEAHRHTLNPRRRDLTWAFVASMAAVMAIFMTTPILNDRHYWLLFGLGLAMVTVPHRTRSIGSEWR
jgi:O-antigen ligase